MDLTIDLIHAIIIVLYSSCKEYIVLRILNFMTSSPFQTIGLLGRLRCEETAKTITDIISHLSQCHYKLVTDPQTASVLSSTELVKIHPKEELGRHCDVVIVVGGDGSLLSAARAVLAHQTPLIGINRGYLGFLTDLHPQNFADELDQILAGHFRKEERFLLETTITDHADHTIATCDNALNDVVLAPGKMAHLIDFDVFINDEFMCHMRADGLIIATPTGSTAYSLSAGGPILHPQLQAIVLAPMFPHTLGSRPIVVSSNSHIHIVIDPACDSEPNISIDGQRRTPVPAGGHILIHKQATPVTLIHPLSYQYFATLRQKLGWEVKPHVGQR